MSTPVFLLGYQRSGTTALAHVLSRAFAHEGGIFTVNGKLPYLLERWLTANDLDARHLRVDEITYALSRKSPTGIGASTWMTRVDGTLRSTAADVADGRHHDVLALARRILMETYSAWPLWGDKYNEYLTLLPYLDAMVPEARYIMLFRNPYEVAASIAEWAGDRPWRPSTVEHNIEKWTTWNSNFLRFAQTLPPHRYFVLEYHDLCRGRDADRLSEFVGINLEKSLQELVPRRNTIDDPPVQCSARRVWESLQMFVHR